jgi:hydrogenase maturation protein HypF
MPAARGDRVARAVEVRGVVQGVGFRPFVWRLASELGLEGTVVNRAGQVLIEVAGPVEAVDEFAIRLRTDAPPRARVEDVVVRPIGREIAVGSGFTIEESTAAGSSERLFPPDIATCDDCLSELRDPADRRYRYPFTNCTNCGPRATIIEDLPYDRSRTSMRSFPLCTACEAEYRDPANRRFHAEPVACPDCGPQLSYRRPGDAAPAAHRGVALDLALADLRAGRIVAVKGLGGYHLACDATDAAAVDRLRDRKHRWAKPFAVMVADVAAARRLAKLTREEVELLTSPARPIVLVERRMAAAEPGATVGAEPRNAEPRNAEPRNAEPRNAEPRNAEPPLADAVMTSDPTRDAALNRRIGIFLPYTPLHHLLLEGLRRPIVLTSGNLADEPLATDDAEALERLAGIADSVLTHDREIRARYDDTVTRVVAGRESIIRRGRGYAPEPLGLPIAAPSGQTILAVGAELKHTFTLARGDRAHVAPHIGDLEDLLTHRAFEANLAHLERLLDIEPEYVAHDLHPAYLSTQYAMSHFPEDRRIGVQHHHAHVASAAAEAGLAGQFIGVAYDGLGMGDDGTFWGGEVLVATLANYRRVARFGQAPMPGGALAVKKPYRMALGYLLGVEGGLELEELATTAAQGAGKFLARLDPREVDVVRVQVDRRLNAPVASSAGRLYDAVASLLGIRDIAEYEAQAAIEMELLAEPGRHKPLDFAIARRNGQSNGTSLLVYDQRPTLRDLLECLAAGEPSARLAARFQETVAAVTRSFVREIGRETGIGTVVLSGGVFQNQWLATTLVRRLERDGFEVHTNQKVPANDGGISYGQAAVAAARLAGAS